jgi:PAS domain S-box-containing protein
MMHLDSLALKLNLALLVFFIVLGAATAAFIIFGFNRTRDNASARSEEALADLGADVLQYIAYTQADYGASAMEWAQELGHRAARYLEQFKASGANAPLDIARFVKAPNGVWYDPHPDRVSDVVVLNHPTLDDAALDDIAYSAALDALFPALMEGYPGESGGEAYYPITIVFVGANSVGRTYPPSSGIEVTVPQNFDVAAFINKFGPASNPKRRTIWTIPYEDRLGKGLVITAQTPVYQGDVFRGIFEVDLSIENLVGVVDAVKPTDSGFAFYVDQEGGIMQTASYDLLAREIDGGNEVLASVIERMTAGEPGVDRVTLGGREFYLASAPMQGVGGGFAVVAPISELTANAAAITAEIDDQADRTLLLVLGFMTTLFAIALIGATYLNRRVLVRPIVALVGGTRAVAEGDFGTQIAVRGNDELAALGHSFNQMTAQIQQEVREREAAQGELSALFAAMTDRVVVLDNEGRFLRVPQTGGTRLLEDVEPVEGRLLQDVRPPEMATAILEAIRECLASGATVTAEFPFDIPDGRRRWLSSVLSPLSATSVVAVVRDITDRVNAQQELERQVAERTRELTTLLGISGDVASTLELAPLLSLVINEVQTIADYDRCSIYTLEGDRFVLLDSRGAAAGDDTLGFAAAAVEPISSRIRRKEPVIIDDVREDSPEARAYRAGAGELFETAFKDIHGWIGVPLALKDRVIGMLTLSHRERAFYTERHARLLIAIASQVAVAIENARLYEQAQQLAAVEERQRLARELHDSVSQALYGIALGARTARTLLDSNAAQAVEPVEYVLSLAEAGLAEMRALIFELRPESLETEGLVEALLKQTAATRARYGLEVTTELCDEPSLSLPEKEVFYRVAQEALHNVVKHAHASHVDLRLAANNGSVVLEVRDDGKGFDAGQSFPGHMGLVSMRERATSLGAYLDVESAQGKGTTVRLSLAIK